MGVSRRYLYSSGNEECHRVENVSYFLLTTAKGRYFPLKLRYEDTFLSLHNSHSTVLKYGFSMRVYKTNECNMMLDGYICLLVFLFLSAREHNN